MATDVLITTAFSCRPADPERRSMTGTADDLPTLLEAAWQLQRYTEGPVEILDHRDNPAGEVIGVLNLEWTDGETQDSPHEYQEADGSWHE